jgi:hypothetical protein
MSPVDIAAARGHSKIVEHLVKHCDGKFSNAGILRVMPHFVDAGDNLEDIAAMYATYVNGIICVNPGIRMGADLTQG